MLTVSVENFGPIRSGTVKLRPLTVFIGANNSGKSYMAMLIYALSRAVLSSQNETLPRFLMYSRLRMPREFATLSSVRLPIFDHTRELLEDSEVRREVSDWFNNLMGPDGRARSGPRTVAVVIHSLPLPLQKSLRDLIGDYFALLVSELEQELRRCFATRIAGLTSVFAEGKSFSIRISNDRPHWDINLDVANRLMRSV